MERAANGFARAGRKTLLRYSYGGRGDLDGGNENGPAGIRVHPPALFWVLVLHGGSGFLSRDVKEPSFAKATEGRHTGLPPFNVPYNSGTFKGF